MSPAFTIKADGLLNRLITDITIFPPFDPTAVDPQHVPQVRCKGLWDTGATGTCISPRIAADLKLIPTGKTNVEHADGVGERPTYLINVGLPHGVGVYGVPAVGFEGGDHIDVLIGMDIIASGDFAITQRGDKTCFSFRTPSEDFIDYVEQEREPTQPSSEKISRNSPCPCGSGKKYKRCCGQ